MALKVFDLACAAGHVFEGWFRSRDDYEKQTQAGWVECPVCGSTDIHKQLSAPRLNLRHGVGSKAPSVAAPDPKPSASDPAPSLDAMQAQLFNHIKQAIRNTDNVGADFAEEVRKIHDGQAPDRAIRGSATHEEYEALREDGIEVMPIPAFLDDDKLN